MIKVENNFKIIVIGGSAGSFSIVQKILSSLPGDFPFPLILCLHRLKEFRNGFAESLNLASSIPVLEPLDKTQIEPGTAYLSPSNYHMLVEPGYKIALSTDADHNFSRPSIDLTFMTAGYSAGKNMVGIILSGANTDGAQGLYIAFKNGAYTVVQNPENAGFRTMPEDTLKYFTPHKILTDKEIIEFINSLKYEWYH